MAVLGLFFVASVTNDSYVIQCIYINHKIEHCSHYPYWPGCLRTIYTYVSQGSQVWSNVPECHLNLKRKTLQRKFNVYNEEIFYWQKLTMAIYGFGDRLICSFH